MFYEVTISGAQVLEAKFSAQFEYEHPPNSPSDLVSVYCFHFFSGEEEKF